MAEKTSPWTFDVRVRERNLKAGSVTDKDVEKYLATLPDLADQVEPFGTSQPALAQPIVEHVLDTSYDDADDEDEDEDDEDEDDLEEEAAVAAPEPAAHGHHAPPPAVAAAPVETFETAPESEPEPAPEPAAAEPHAHAHAEPSPPHVPAASDDDSSPTE